MALQSSGRIGTATVIVGSPPKIGGSSVQTQESEPVGQITSAYQNQKSSPAGKNILVFRIQKPVYIPRHPVPAGGAFRGRTNVERDAMDATASGAQGIAGRSALRERSTGARTDGAANCLRRNSHGCVRGPARALARRARTAKSCGPDAPRLASSLAEMHPARPGLRCIVNPRGDGGKSAWLTGESTYTP
jgi:hypothetical protein